MMDHHLIVSFVHGYNDLKLLLPGESIPSLWVHTPDGVSVHNYPFPRNITDFHHFDNLLVGVMPTNGRDFAKLPRFGLTGLTQTRDYIYAGSWNGVYKIRKSDFGLEGILSNPLMNDMHGIWADDERVITMLTGKDTVVISDSAGVPIDHFTVSNDLSVHKDPSLEETDWRFVSKQFRGATGIWHFNYVQVFDDEVWLTSRNLGAMIVVDLNTKKSHIRTMNHKTPVLLHDGKLHERAYYFTSIDGKIIIAHDAGNAPPHAGEKFEGMERFSRDLVCEIIRLKETAFGREPNWCRGIACWNDNIYVSIDGRYDEEDLSFGVLGVKRSGEKVYEDRMRWSDVGSPKDLRYVTGFDLVTY